MKKINLIIVLLFLTLVAEAQTDNITICHTSSTDRFAMFASNKKFNSEHAKPRPYTHISEEGGKMIKIKCSDGTEANGYFIPAKKKTNNWIFVFQEWWGLNDYIKNNQTSYTKILEM